MPNRWSRFLAALGLGLGRRKAEADVAYDPALDEDANGGDLRPGEDLDHSDRPVDPGRPS